MGSQRRGLFIALYGTLILGGLLLSRHLVEVTYAVVHPGQRAYLNHIVITVILIYIFVAALPFVPAAEIGLILMLMLGAEVAALVYASTVLALMLAYLVGRAVPAEACAAAFGFLGFKRARKLVSEMHALETNVRLDWLLAHGPAPLVPKLLRHRYLTLALALNLPGNSLIGGGGGIALLAGMSGLYPMPAYIATVAVAVAPVPLIFACSALLG